MNYILALYFVLLLVSCSTSRNKSLVIESMQSNNVIRPLIQNHNLKGHIGNNFYEVTNTDSLVYLNVLSPFEQNYPIDSIYYFYYNESNYKILAQSEYQKGLLYLEVDKKGNHTRVTNFGGYVTAVKNVVSKNNINDIELTFTVDAWPSTMPDTLSQHVKIKSSTDNIDFQVYYKGDKGKWIETEKD